MKPYTWYEINWKSVNWLCFMVQHSIVSEKNERELPSFQEIDIWGEASFETWEVQCAGFLLDFRTIQKTIENLN